jgi:hypothetical protein
MVSHQRLLPSLLVACVIGLACSSNAPPTSGPKAGAGGDGGEGGDGGSGGSLAGSGGSSTGGHGGSMAGSGGSSTAGTGGSETGGSVGSVDAAGPDTAGSGGGDDAGIPDAPAPAGDAPSNLPPGTRMVYVLHDSMAGTSINDPSRKSLLDVLNSMHDSHGIVVKMVDSVTPASAMPDAALIIIGPNASMFNHHPSPDLKTVAVPLMVSKDGHTDEIGLGTVLNTEAIYDTIKIIKTDHPLAAGLAMGTVQVLTTTNAQRLVRFSNLGPDAIKIATGPADNNTFTIVGYEKGGQMAGGFKAPAKRMGFFWHRPAAVTADGTKLLKAAVDWLLRP